MKGIITVDDVREVPREAWDSTTVGQAARATDERVVIDDKEDAWEALTQMLETDARRLLVVHEGRLEGVITRESILQVVRAKMQLQG
jgi:CBS domain-containing protein